MNASQLKEEETIKEQLRPQDPSSKCTPSLVRNKSTKFGYEDSAHIKDAERQTTLRKMDLQRAGRRNNLTKHLKPSKNQKPCKAETKLQGELSGAVTDQDKLTCPVQFPWRHHCIRRTGSNWGSKRLSHQQRWSPVPFTPFKEPQEPRKSTRLA